MPSKPVYCRSCKGYGETYAETVTRWGDSRIQSRDKPIAIPCTKCSGTGYIAAKARPRPEWAGEVTKPLPKPESAEPVRPPEGDLEL
jgi:DnaJ-class molecular chaperone